MELEHGGHFERIEAELTESLHDGHTGEVLVIGIHLLRRECPHEGHGAVKVIGMRGAVAGQVAAGLTKHGCMRAVRVGDATDLRELAVEVQMRFGIARWP